MSEDQIKVLKIVQNMLSTNFSRCSRDCAGCKANVEELDECNIDMIINEIDKLFVE